MMVALLEQFANELGAPLWLVFFILVWVIVIKACALWRAARLNKPVWFIALLIINTFGIFEVLYLFLFSKIQLPHVKEKIKKKKRRK